MAHFLKDKNQIFVSTEVVYVENAKLIEVFKKKIWQKGLRNHQAIQLVNNACICW